MAAKTCQQQLEDDIRACAEQYPPAAVLTSTRRRRPDPNKPQRDACLSAAFEDYWDCQLGPILEPLDLVARELANASRALNKSISDLKKGKPRR